MQYIGYVVGARNISNPNETTVAENNRINDLIKSFRDDISIQDMWIGRLGCTVNPTKEEAILQMRRNFDRWISDVVNSPQRKNIKIEVATSEVVDGYFMPPGRDARQYTEI